MKKKLIVALISLMFPVLAFAQTQSYTATAYVSECVNLRSNLRIGSTDRSSNYEVSLLQDFLSPQYLYLPDGPTGYFGNATARGVRAFQEDNGISQTGTVGPITRARIASLSCGGNSGRIPPGTGVCTSDAKLCPDGRYVGRVAPYCEFASCQGGSSQAPALTSLYPSQVSFGNSITISGTGFTSTQNEIFLNNSSAGFATLSGAGTLTFVVPRSIGTPCPANVYCIQGSRELTPGTYSLKVVNANGTSNTINVVITSSSGTGPILPPQPTTFSSSVTSGNAPLSVQFYADRNTTSCSNNSPYSVTFGDGAQARMDINGINRTTSSIWDSPGTSCNGYFTTHTYTQPGTYTAQLYKTVYNSCLSSYNTTACPLWYSREELVGTLTITVSQPQTQLQLPVITNIQPVLTGSSSVLYSGEAARITGSNLALIFPPSGIGARLDVTVSGVNGGIVTGGITVSPQNAVGTSLTFTVPNVTPGTYSVVVNNSSGASNAYPVTIASRSGVCTADARICPDGSVVSRVYPTCEFATCPATSSGPAITSLTGESQAGTTGSILYVGRKGRVSWRGVSADRINIGGQTAPITITAIAMPSCVPGADCTNATMYMGEFTVPNLSEGTYSAFLVTPNNTNGPSLYPVSVKVTSVVNVGPAISSIGGQSQGGSYGNILYPGRTSYVSWKGMSADRITIGTQTAPITIIAIAMPTCVNQGPCDATTHYSGEFTTPAMANGIYSAFLVTSNNTNGPAYYPVTIQNQ